MITETIDRLQSLICLQDRLRLLTSHNTPCTSKILLRPPISLMKILEGASPTQREAELEACVLVGNILGLSRRMITHAGCSPERSYQSSLRPLCGNSSGTICPHIPRALKILPRPLKRENIGRSLK